MTMAAGNDSPPVPAAGPETLRRIRETLVGAGYAQDAVSALTGMATLATARGSADPLLLHRLREPVPLPTLVRLFLVGTPVSVEAALAALRPMELEEWVAAGLLVVEGATAWAPVELQPCDGFL